MSFNTKPIHIQTNLCIHLCVLTSGPPQVPLCAPTVTGPLCCLSFFDLWIMDYDYPFGIFKFFLQIQAKTVNNSTNINKTNHHLKQLSNKKRQLVGCAHALTSRRKIFPSSHYYKFFNILDSIGVSNVPIYLFGILDL